MSPTLITIGSFELRWYSALIAVAVLISYWLVMRECDKLNVKKEFMFNLLFWALILGIVGARLYYVLFNLSYYKEHLTEIYKIWEGGLAINGGMVAGFFVALGFCKKYKVNLFKVLDIMLPALILSQAIGRWGNFFNSEAYGISVSYHTLVDMKIIPQFIIDNMYINGAYHLPMFYFESLWCLLGFIILIFYRRRKYIKNGQVLAFYLMWYGFARFFIELFRTDSLMLGSIKIACVVSTLMFIIGIIITIVQKKKPKLEELYNQALEKEIRY